MDCLRPQRLFRFGFMWTLWHFGFKTIFKGDTLYYANERFVTFHDFYMMSTLEFWTSCFSQQPCLFLKLFSKQSNYGNITQGATFGIQLKSSEAGEFSPFSPLHAFLARLTFYHENLFIGRETNVPRPSSVRGFEFRGHVKASPGTKKAVRVRNKWVSESVVQP